MIIKLICGILENFHFHTPVENVSDEQIEQQEQQLQQQKQFFRKQKHKQKQQKQQQQQNLQQEKEQQEQLQQIFIKLNKKTTLSLPTQIYNILTNFLIPQLFSNITNTTSRQSPLRISLLFAIVRLLRLLPPQEMNLQLPKLLNMICVTLKERDQVVRDSARKTLCQVSFPFSFFFFLSFFFLSLFSFFFCLCLEKKKRFTRKKKKNLTSSSLSPLSLSLSLYSRW